MAVAVGRGASAVGKTSLVGAVSHEAVEVKVAI